MSEIIRIIAKRLRNYRIQQEMTQEELAERAGLHHTYIGQVERGEKNITVGTLERILEPLNVSFSELFTGIELRSNNDIPRQCYDLISSLPKEKQQIVYDILCYIDKVMY